MEKDNKVFLLHMLDCIRKIELYVNGYSQEEFLADSKTMDAVIRQIEVLGEAANNVPGDLQAEYPRIPWRKMIDTRNRIIHGYASVELGIIWSIAQNDLDALEVEIEQVLEKLK